MSDEWSIEDEIRLCRWISEFKPAGIHKHFHMMSIIERMNNREKYPVVLLFDKLKSEGKSTFTASDIWEKLSKLYNLDRLDELEDRVDEEDTKSDKTSKKEEEDLEIPLRRLIKLQRDFNLPWDDYGELMVENARDGNVAPEDKDEEITEQELRHEEQTVEIEVSDQPEDLEKENTSKRVTRSSNTPKVGRVTRSRGAVEQDEDDQKAPAEDNQSPENEIAEKPPQKKTRNAKIQTAASNPPPDNRPLRNRRKSITTVPVPPIRSSGRVASRLRNKK